MVVAELEFRKVAVQVLLSAVLVDAVHPALEDAERPLDRFGVDGAADILVGRVLDRLVAAHLRADLDVEAALVGHQSGFTSDILADDASDRLLVSALDMHEVDLPAALDQAKDGTLAGRTSLATFGEGTALALRRRRWVGLLAEVGLICLDGPAAAAERPNRAITHCLADAMAHEPRGLQGDAESTVELIAAHALLAGGQERNRLEPDVQRHMAGLEDRPDLDGEWLAAGPALVDADAGAFASKGSGTVDGTAMRADRAIRLDVGLDPRIGSGLIVETGIAENRGHGLSPWRQT